MAMRVGAALLLAVAVLAAAACSVRGGIQHYAHARVRPQVPFYARVGMYAPDDAPYVGRPGNGKSYVSIDLKMHVDLNTTVETPELRAARAASKSAQTSLAALKAMLKADKAAKAGGAPHTVTVLLFHSDNNDLLGYYDASTMKRYVCCTPDVLKKGRCLHPNRILLSSEVKTRASKMTGLYLHELVFDAEHPVNVLRMRYDITRSGIYYLFIVSCNSVLSEHPDVLVQGTVEWLNPYGYLPGEMYPFLPFYGVLSLSYMTLGILWLIKSALHWRALLDIQNWIGGVIGLGMIEASTWYFDNLEYNNTGLNAVGAIVFGILVSTLKRTVSRVLVLVVAFGYGVVKPTLGAVRYKVTLLGLGYFIFSAALQIVESVERTTTVSWSVVVFLVTPVALLDTLFYWWVFLSLLRTIAQLKARRQAIKASMYKWLFNVLVGSGLLSTAVIVYQALVYVSSTVDQRWETWWATSAFWQLLYFLILLAIAFLWRPRSNNTRYAYAEMKAGVGDNALAAGFALGGSSAVASAAGSAAAGAGGGGANAGGGGGVGGGGGGGGGGSGGGGGGGITAAELGAAGGAGTAGAGAGGGLPGFDHDVMSASQSHDGGATASTSAVQQQQQQQQLGLGANTRSASRDASLAPAPKMD